MTDLIRVVQYGIGAIGKETAKLILKESGSNRLALVGAIDIDPAKVNRSLGDIVGVTSDVIVSSDAQKVLADTRPDVVLHTTSSFLPQVEKQLMQCIRSGAAVVSSTEELPYPFDRHANIAERLDSAARKYGVTVLGTGVNPGYAMDVLALTATGVCTRLRSVTVQRRVDIGKRRESLQRKVGVGITPEEFRERQKQGGFGHIGLVESLRLIMRGLNWPIDRVSETLEPIMSESKIQTHFLTVLPGKVAGIQHSAQAFMSGQLAVSLCLQMYIGVDEPEDRITVDGAPPVNLVVEGGIYGDTATVGALVNAIPQVLNASPGLQTVIDLPIPRSFLPAI